MKKHDEHTNAETTMIRDGMRDGMRDGRRALLRRCAGALAVLVTAPACSKANAASFSCGEVQGLSADEAQARTALAYADVTADTSRACASCAQYVKASADGSCGGCKVLKGPIHPNGTCKAFSPRG